MAVALALLMGAASASARTDSPSVQGVIDEFRKAVDANPLLLEDKEAAMALIQALVRAEFGQFSPCNQNILDHCGGQLSTCLYDNPVGDPHTFYAHWLCYVAFIVCVVDCVVEIACAQLPPGVCDVTRFE